ncbi:MAG: hypothetical protein AB7P00_35040 [Sandaracinaceae bacterium]
MSHRAALFALASLSVGCGTVFGLDAGSQVGTVDVVGTWHDCRSTLIYGADGTTTAINHELDDCTARGTYVLDGDVLMTTWPEAACGFGPTSTRRRVVRGERGLTSIDLATGSVSQRADGSMFEHVLYRIVGMDEGSTSTGQTVLSVVGDPSDSFGSGCYWSEDGACGGLFSCSGEVAQWRFEDGDRLNASISCGGGCPCGAIVTGTRVADGSIDGTYDGVNCDHRFAGTFTATPR